jgi:hypothetical protein
MNTICQYELYHTGKLLTKLLLEQLQKHLTEIDGCLSSEHKMLTAPMQGFLDHNAGGAVEGDKVFSGWARNFLVGDPGVVAPCQALEELAAM